MSRLTTRRLAGMTAGAAAATIAAVLWAASPADAGACASPTATWVGQSLSDPQDFGDPANWDRVDNTSSAPQPGDRLCIPSDAAIPFVRASSEFDVASVEAHEPLEIWGKLTVGTLEADHLSVLGTLAPTTAQADFLYSSGTISGGTTTVDGAGQDVSITQLYLTDGAVLDAKVPLRDIAASQYVQLDKASRLVLRQPATFDEQWTVNTGTFDDPGWVEVPSSSSLTYTAADSATNVNWYTGIVNQGTVSVTAGTLRIYNGVAPVSAGSWSAGGTGRLDLGGPDADHPLRLGNGSTLSGVTLVGRVRITGTVTSTATTLDGAFREGPGLLRLNGTTTWKYAILDGPADEVGTTEVPVGATMTVPDSGVMYVSGAQRLEVKGTASLGDNTYLDLADDARLVVPGTWSATGPFSSAYHEDAARVVVPVGGTFTVGGSSGTSTLYPRIENHGTVSSTGPSGSELFLYRPAGQQSGTFVASGGGVLRLAGNGGVWPLDDQTLLDHVSVEGDLVVAGGTVEARGVRFLSGTHAGPGVLRLTQGASLVGGTFTGPVSVPSGQTAAVPAGGYMTFANGSSLDLAGTLDVGDAGALNLVDRANLSVTGSLRLGDDSYLTGYDGQSLVTVAPGGALRSVGTGGSTHPATVYTPIVNRGTVSSGGNPLRLQTATAPTDRSTGAFTAGAEALQLDGSQGSLGLTTGATVTGATVQGYLDVDGSVTATDLRLEGGLVGGSGTLTLAGTPVWVSGSMGGSGATIIPAAATGGLPAAAGSGYVADGRTLVVRGTRTLGGDLSTEDGGAVDVQGTVDLLDDASLGGNGLVLVEGTVTKSTGSGQAFVGALDNEGLVRVSAGTLSVDGLNGSGFAGTLTGGRWQSAGTGSLDLGGVSTLAADVTVDGTTATVEGLDFLDRVAAAGTLRLLNGADLDLPFGSLRQDGRVLLSPTSTVHVGTYVQSVTGQLTSALSAAGRGTVTADDAVTLAGGLSLDRDPAYLPSVGTRLAVVTGSGLSGAFSRYDGLAIDGTRHFDPSDDATSAGVVVAGGAATSNTLRVSNVQTTASAPTALSLSWDAPTDADQVQVVMRKGTTPATSPDGGTTVYAGAGRSARVSGLEPATSYSFSVFTWRDGVSSRPVTLVRHGTDVRARPVAGHRLRVAVRDVATGGLRRGAVVQVWRRERVGDAFVLVRRVSADDGVATFRVNGTPRALRLTTRGVGVHLAGREVVRPRW